jgi:hypothetical protein
MTTLKVGISMKETTRRGLRPEPRAISLQPAVNIGTMTTLKVGISINKSFE